MFLISAEKFSLWKKKQISKGGDNHSLNLLIDSLGGLSDTELNLLKINPEKNLNIPLWLFPVYCSFALGALETYNIINLLVG